MVGSTTCLEGKGEHSANSPLDATKSKKNRPLKYYIGFRIHIPICGITLGKKMLICLSLCVSVSLSAEIQSCLVSSGDVGCGMFQCFNNNSCEIQGLHHICLTLLHNAGRYDSQVGSIPILSGLVFHQCVLSIEMCCLPHFNT